MTDEHNIASYHGKSVNVSLPYCSIILLHSYREILLLSHCYSAIFDYPALRTSFYGGYV